MYIIGTVSRVRSFPFIYNFRFSLLYEYAEVDSFVRGNGSCSLQDENHYQVDCLFGLRHLPLALFKKRAFDVKT